MSNQIKQPEDMSIVLARCLDDAKQAGAKEAAVRGYRIREVSLEYRDGKVEKISEATRRGASIELFVNDRYSVVSTSDLRRDATKQLITDSIAVAKTLAPDPFRGLPDPSLYKDQPRVDLQLEDSEYDKISAEHTQRFAKDLYDAARGARGNEAILSISTWAGSTLSESWLMTSNGFSGANRGTSYSVGAQASAKDADGRRPEEYDYASSRFWAALPKAEELGRGAAERTLARLGSR